MITEEVLKALSEGRRVEYLATDNKWHGIQRMGDRFYYQHDPVETSAASLLWCMAELKWRLPIEQRDWMGALEWIKEGKHVKRSSKPGAYARLSFNEPKLVTTFALTPEDYQAKDWVVAGD
jgi:hypothetical protein